MTLCVRGYRFGESNHAVYLIDALRRADPALLRNDWWAQSTLQYHFVFNTVTAWLIRLGVVEPAFLVGYLALAVLLHVAWRKLALRLGGSDGSYLLSVILYYILAGGVGLGMYHFLQDSAFLPSNIANVAMLWGVYFLIAGRLTSAGIALGIAGLFHINHALFGIGLWAGAFVYRRTLFGDWLAGTVVLLALSAVQIVPAAGAVLARSGRLPLHEFVDLFVRVRHPHHFDPRSWHWGVWLCFIAPLPAAVLAYRRERPTPATPGRRRAAVVFLLFAGAIVFALLTAGFWFVGETFVQLNLYRFSIYPKLLSCVAVAWLLWDRTPAVRQWLCGALVAAVAACACVVMFRPALYNVHVAFFFFAIALVALATLAGIRRELVAALLMGISFTFIAYVGGANRIPAGVEVGGLAGDDPAYRSVAAWARDHTATDSVFLVPPDEESFRLYARRAIVVNFKGVPQLSAELPEWRDRLLKVLDFQSTRDLLALPRPMGRTLAAIRARYDSLPPEHLFAVARDYHARYVVLTRRPDAAPSGTTCAFDNGRYFLYDLTPEP
jgi:hypothetical protein